MLSTKDGYRLYFHAWALPWLLFVLVLAVSLFRSKYADAPLHGTDDWEPYVTVHSLKGEFTFKRTGPILPFLLLAVQMQLTPFRHLIEAGILDKSVGIPDACKKAGCSTCFSDQALDRFMWFFFTVVVWLVMSTLRAIMYVAWMKNASPFSDHIFLLCSLVAQLSTNIAIAHLTFLTASLQTNFTRYCSPKLRAVSTLVLAYLMFIWLMREANTTAVWFHSREQVILGFVAGLLCFGSLSFLWIRHFVKNSCAQPQQTLLMTR